MKAIAMICTQEDWDSVKSEIKNYRDIICFKTCKYLVTNYLGKMGMVSNTNIRGEFIYERKIYETFDKDILFNALDIEVEKFWDSSELQYLDTNGIWRNYIVGTKVRLKPKNPELTELKQKAKSLGFKLVKL